MQNLGEEVTLPQEMRPLRSLVFMENKRYRDKAWAYTWIN
jgi:hypothetical protein